MSSIFKTRPVANAMENFQKETKIISRYNKIFLKNFIFCVFVSFSFNSLHFGETRMHSEQNALKIS
jgi:hypothetical protein